MTTMFTNQHRRKGLRYVVIILVQVPMDFGCKCTYCYKNVDFILELQG